MNARFHELKLIHDRVLENDSQYCLGFLISVTGIASMEIMNVTKRSEN